MNKTAVKLIAIVVTLILCCHFTACSRTEQQPAQNGGSVSDEPVSNVSDDEEKTSDEVTTPTAKEEDATTPETDDKAPEESTTPERTEPLIPEKPPETETSLVTTKDKEDTPPEGKALAPAEKANSIVGLAKSLAGNEFKFGGASPEDGFDNSGLIYYVLTQNGIACPRLTHEIARIGAGIGYDELQPGDLVFFCMEDSGNPDFGGIYIGDGQMMISMSEGKPVKAVDITTNYYKTTFVYGIAVAR